MPEENLKVKVWRKFEKKNENGNLMKFRIQQLPEDKLEELVKYISSNYIHEEILISAAGIPNDPLAIEEAEQTYRLLPGLHLSLVCCLDNEVKPEDVTRCDIIAAFVLCLSVRHADSHHFHPKSEPCLKLRKFFIDAIQKDTIYDEYNIDRYLDDAGLSVLPKYRRIGLGVELMEVRDEVGRAEGIKVSASQFTSTTSQNLASKCGYKTYFEQDYDEIGNFIGVKFPDHTKSLKMMAKVLDETSYNRLEVSEKK